MANSKFKKRTSKAVWIVIVLCLCTGFYHRYKPLPMGINALCGEYTVAAEKMRFLSDLRYEKVDGHKQQANEEIETEQQIFDAMLAQIAQAQKFIVIDYFLVNRFLGQDKNYYRDVSQELIDALIRKKQSNPDIEIVFISDPINSLYGGVVSPLFSALKQAGIAVVFTDLGKLRDSNSIYSSLWRVGLQWFGNSTEGGWLPNPFEKDSPKITLRSWLRMANFKANHRKVLISDYADSVQAIISSANPHTASSGHSNVAIQISDQPVVDLLNNELAIIAFSDPEYDISALQMLAEQFATTMAAMAAAESKPKAQMDYNQVSCQSENQIKQQILRWIEQSQTDDALKVAMFYLSDREIITAIKAAAERGVMVQIILDPNKDAFGMTKDGVPNRVVAHELLAANNSASNNIEIRWYKTHGEQFHSKLFVFEENQGERPQVHISLGSANLTKRNIGNFNLETNITVSAAKQSEIAKTIRHYFDRLWHNRDGLFTVDYAAFGDDSRLKYWRYRVMEATGLSTF
jgi:phosphatidylserine/phosphatidylglycerophosphate/cardiolipin synthase-like enzyme